MRDNRVVVSTCMTCKHCYLHYDQDGGAEYYCNTSNENCSDYFYPYGKQGLTYDDIRKWVESHWVEPNEVCEDYEKGATQ